MGNMSTNFRKTPQYKIHENLFSDFKVFTQGELDTANQIQHFAISFKTFTKTNSFS